MQSRYLGSCGCNSWAAHAYRWVTSATSPAPSGLRKHRWGFQVHHHDLAIYDARDWRLWLDLYNWIKQARDHFLLLRPSICLTLIQYMFFHPANRVIISKLPMGIGPFHILSLLLLGERALISTGKSHEGEICRLREDCRPFSSHRCGFFAWMDTGMSQGSILTARWGISLRNKAF